MDVSILQDCRVRLSSCNTDRYMFKSKYKMGNMNQKYDTDACSSLASIIYRNLKVHGRKTSVFSIFVIVSIALTGPWRYRDYHGYIKIGINDATFPIAKLNSTSFSRLHTEYCRVKSLLYDWRETLNQCSDKMDWMKNLNASSTVMASPMQSYISYLDIKPAGEYSKLFLQCQNINGVPLTSGGDHWKTKFIGPSSPYVTVNDHANGSYEFLFRIIEPGTYMLYIYLEYTRCSGLRDPPAYWFAIGNIQGSNQPSGYLGHGESKDYLHQILWNGEPLRFEVHPSNDTDKEKPVVGKCDFSCLFLWDGLGRWKNNQWMPYLEASFNNCQPSAKRKLNTLWIYGDSNARRFFSESLLPTQICRSIFKTCNLTYNWVYKLRDYDFEKSYRDLKDFSDQKVLNELSNVLNKKEMNENSVMILNFGLHFVASLSFARYQTFVKKILVLLAKKRSRGTLPEIIWKTTTEIHRERMINPYYDARRFMTTPRIKLFNAYATSQFCKAGFKVLDIYPLTEAYPKGTDARYNRYDAIHYEGNVFETVVDLLEKYFTCISASS